MNPRCPKCGRLMRSRLRLFKNNPESKKKTDSAAKYWVCPTRTKEHGFVSYKAGSQVIV
jgi:hypothetical protein